jgi:tetratricopeptide (TPR) repeat protein
MRRSVDRLRVNAELVDAESGSHLWAERYEAELAHVFAVQDQICAAVVGAILPVVGDAELGRAARRSPASLGAWEAYQRGLWHLRKFNAADNDKAIAFFRQAIAADGSFAWAHLGIAHAYSAEGTTFFTRPLDEALRLFNECVQRAFEIDPSDTVIQSFLAYSLLATGNHASAVQQAERVLERNPSSLQALLAKGRALLFGGHPTEGREMLQSALRLSPNDPGKPIILYEIALSYYDERDYERAVDEARRLKAAYPNHPWANICLAASLAQLGQTIEARDALDNAVAVSPKSFAVYVCQRPPWMRPEEHAHKLDGLHKAGWRPGQ